MTDYLFYLLSLFLLFLLCLTCMTLLIVVARRVIDKLRAENEILAEEKRRRQKRDDFLYWEQHQGMLDDDNRSFRSAQTPN